VAVLQRLLPLLLVGVLLVAVLLLRPPLAVPERLGAVARRTVRWRLAGLVVGLAVAATSVQSGALGRGVLLAVPLLALCVLLGVVGGELGVRAPAGGRRSAAIEVRSARGYLPRVLTPLVAAATAGLAALLVFTTAIASADDLGRAGRSLSRACSAVSAEGRGPWPGSYYSVPLAAVVVVGLVLAAVALASIARRPRQGEDAVLDDALRRQAATAVVAAVGLLVTVPLVGTGLVAASGLLQICAAPPAWTAIGRLLVVVVPLAVALGTWCAALLVVPGTTRTAEPARR
jgi:hypothetical protein